MLELGTPVILYNFDGKSNRKGRIAGPTVQVQYSCGKTKQLYPVELEEGFYSKDESIYVKILLAHYDSIKPQYTCQNCRKALTFNTPSGVCSTQCLNQAQNKE